MRMLIAVFACFVAVGCDEATHSNYHDAGVGPFKQIGAPCQPDTPPMSECGYWPQHYCSDAGVCTSTCNGNTDCSDASVCFGASDLGVGECRIPASIPDGG